MSLFQAFLRFKHRFTERRRSMREQHQFPVWIDIGDGKRQHSGTVLDVSEGGARILVSSPAELPEVFWLVLSKDRTTRRQCRIVWRSDTMIGVRYLGDVKPDFFPPALN